MDKTHFEVVNSFNLYSQPFYTQIWVTIFLKIRSPRDKKKIEKLPTAAEGIPKWEM